MALETVRFDKEARVARVYRWGELIREWQQTRSGWFSIGPEDLSDSRVGPLLDRIAIRHPYR